MPGAGEWTDPPGGALDTSELEPLLNDVQAYTTQLTDTLTDRFLDSAIPAAQVAEQLATKLHGGVGVALDQISGVGGKLATKIDRKATDLYNSAVSYGNQYSIGYPSMDQVQRGLATKDYLGSMGLTPLVNSGDTLPPPGPGPSLPPPTVGGGGGGNGTYPPGTPPIDPNNCYTNVFGEKICCPVGWGYDPLQGCRPSLPLGDPLPPPPVGSLPCNKSVKFACSDNVGELQQIGGSNALLPLCYHPGYPSEDPSWVLVTYTWIPEHTTTPIDQQVWIPGGWSLCVDKLTGIVWAVERECVGDQFCTIGYKPAPYEPPPPPPPPPPPGDTCPPPADPPCGPNPVKMPPPPSEEEDYCNMLDEWAKAFGAAVELVPKFIGMAGAGDAKGSIAQSIIQALTGVPRAVLPDLLGRLSLWMQQTIRDTLKGTNCDREGMIGWALWNGAFQFVQQWTSILPPQFMESFRQVGDKMCPTRLPSPAEANAAYYADLITQGVWECWTTAAGSRPKEAQLVRDAGRNRPDASQLAMLLRRKQISEDGYKQASRELGILFDGDRERIFNLTQAWPGLEDVIRMMVRDVADPDAVLRNKMDDEFEAKWQGQLKEYGDALGISEDLARYYWRAHWQLPSFTQLAEMLHRLRPGEVDDEVAVTIDDVRETLRQNDMAPAWVDSLIAISYRPVTRTDATRMYSLRTIKDAQLQAYIQDDGYTETDAKALVDFYKTNRRVSEVKKSGIPPMRTLIQQYARQEISEDDFSDLVEKISLSPEQTQTLKDSGQLARRTYQRQTCIKATKAGYMRGIWSDGDAVSELVSCKLETEEAIEIVDAWRRERDSKGKQIAAEKLCKWRTMGIITASEHEQALTRLNYTDWQIRRVTAECELVEYERQQKLLQKAKDKQDEKLLKDREAAYKQQIKDLKAQLKALQEKAAAV